MSEVQIHWWVFYSLLLSAFIAELSWVRRLRRLFETSSPRHPAEFKALWGIVGFSAVFLVGGVALLSAAEVAVSHWQEPLQHEQLSAVVFPIGRLVLGLLMVASTYYFALSWGIAMEIGFVKQLYPPQKMAGLFLMAVLALAALVSMGEASAVLTGDPKGNLSACVHLGFVVLGVLGGVYDGRLRERQGRKSWLASPC